MQTDKQQPFAIDVSNLNKSFADKHVVCDVNLQVKTGEIYGFLGPNGSGKTTTMRMLCGLLEPNSGTGHCIGYDIITETQLIKRHVGYMTQYFSLYEDLTVKENLEFIARIYQLKDRKQCVHDSLERLGLSADKANQLAGTLSGGWKQRLALAAALIHKPKLLLLDEPTAGVDPSARRDFWNEIHELAKTGITTLVSTHYMDEAERCHRLAYIANGRLLAKGTSDEIITHTKLITWLVQGENLAELAIKLKTVKGVEQVSSFGRNLHVTGQNEQLLEQAIKPFQHNYQWQKITPNLEDVFISLVAKAKEKVHE